MYYLDVAGLIKVACNFQIMFHVRNCREVRVRGQHYSWHLSKVVQKSIHIYRWRLEWGRHLMLLFWFARLLWSKVIVGRWMWPALMALSVWKLRFWKRYRGKRYTQLICLHVQRQIVTKWSQVLHGCKRACAYQFVNHVLNFLLGKTQAYVGLNLN